VNEITIDATVLEAEIGKLTTLRDHSPVTSQFTVSGKGMAADNFRELLSALLSVEKSLNYLIENTITFLNNAKDGFVDTDQTSADAFTRMVEESGS
jgi:hypothetical protein